MGIFSKDKCTVILVLCVCILTTAICLPIDFYNAQTFHYTDSKVLKVNESNPGICKENLNNDNITHIKWYRYHKETHKCWHIDERGPCGRYMLFYPIGDTEYGDCDCNFYYRCSRPLVFWPEANRCFFVNDQGPCGSHEWLVLNETGQVECQLNACRFNQTLQPSTKTRYWFEEGGQCYMTLTQGYCDNPNEILYTKWDGYKPTCNVGRICNSRNVRSSVDSTNECIPGQKRDEFGKCRPFVKSSANWFMTFR